MDPAYADQFVEEFENSIGRKRIVMTEIRAVGDFNLATAEIITSSGTLKLISNQISSQINLFEDIQKNSLSWRDIVIQDSAGFVSDWTYYWSRIS